MTDRKHTLISFELCPFAQRAAITLQHKGVPHEIRYVDVYDKPDWFLALSPLGKVPLLVVDEGDARTVLFESAAINEYLDEITTASGHAPLHPTDPLERARHRAWVEVASALVVAQYRLSVATTREDVDTHAASTKATLARFEQALGDAPYFGGDSLSLVDTTAAPALQRLLWQDDIWPALGLFAETPKVRAWAERLVALPAVVASTIPDIRERFHSYLQGKGSPSRDVPPSLLGQRLQRAQQGA